MAGKTIAERTCPTCGSRLTHRALIKKQIYCSQKCGHIGRTTPILERLMAKVVKLPNGCWEFTGCLTKAGYGQLSVNRKAEYTHHLMYQQLRGPIPEGKISDHHCHRPAECVGGDKCQHRRCCNPDHITWTTHAVNTSRERKCPTPASARAKSGATRKAHRTHCPHGHEYTPENTYQSKRQRACKTCKKIYQDARRKRKPKHTHCKRGHEFTEGNTIWESGQRRCRTCRLATQRARRDR